VHPRPFRGAFPSLQRFFSGECQHRAIEMKKTPVNTNQQVAPEAREVSKVIAFSSWGG
jgi:hypothetical protein